MEATDNDQEHNDTDTDSKSSRVSDGEAWAVTSNHIASMVSMAFDMESRRCDSLRGLAGVLLTCSSIISVAILTVAEPLFHFFIRQEALYVLLAIAYAVSLLALSLSVLFSILSQMRFEYQALPDPQSLCSNMTCGTPFSEIDAAEHACKSLQPIYKSLERRNDLMRLLLRVSTICVVVAISTIIIFGAILVILTAVTMR